MSSHYYNHQRHDQFWMLDDMSSDDDILRIFELLKGCSHKVLVIDHYLINPFQPNAPFL